MIYTLLLFFSLAALGVAGPQQGSDTIGFTVSNAFEAGDLTKRQDASGAINGLTNLLSRAVNAVSSGGQCSSECTPWSNDMQSCAVLRSNEEIGQCACGSQPITDMEPCGACFNAQTDVSKFQNLCSNLTGETGAGGATSLGGSSSTVPFETGDPFASSAASPSTTGTSFALGVGGNSGSTLATALGTASITAGDLGRARTTANPLDPPRRRCFAHQLARQRRNGQLAYLDGRGQQWR
ncbi:hypothetical protein BCR35DRAFT_324401 [Leucosporidium creatinivorum]|uniref:Extracellular membrane protein CFEM domain-containing protein n=1 Tax=Leucosporidium creatinivorum TaxID=106004 RepID=A0A1Y2FY18_9BASI|nr:hypothetical protein BCR35DRAFT_324401 [Leucosporidium creatinivorum]